MPIIQQSADTTLESITQLMREPFWYHADFWINLVIGALGLLFSIGAFVEARKAKQAAKEAGHTVKLQTIAVELAEISHKLDRISPDITYSFARDLLAEIQFRLRRVIAPFRTDAELQPHIKKIDDALLNAGEALKAVRPADQQREVQQIQAVYYGVETQFAAINSIVADMLGLFEKRAIQPGE